MSNQLTFQNTTLTAISRNNQIYISAGDLANALQYSDASAVNRIYSRHSDEFTADMSSSVNLTDPKMSQYEQRIFSLRGAHLIAMFARTSVAKDFRKWVLDILDRETQPTLPNTTEDEEALHIIVNLFHSLNGAYEMGQILCKREKRLAQDVSKTVGEHYLYNLNFPARNALDKAKKYIHAKSERIMFVKGMLSLLEEPPVKQLPHTEF